MIYIVRWTDAAFSLDDAAVAPLVVETVGWLVPSDDGFVRVAGEEVDGRWHRGITAIPSELILSICELEVSGVRGER